MIAYDDEYTTEQYRFLKSLYKHKTLTPAYCKRHFRKKSFKRTFKILHDKALIKVNTQKIDDNAVAILNYTLTTDGENVYLVLHDYNRRFWLQGIWLPISVSLATNLLVDGIKWLFPLIIQWVANSP